MQSVSYERSILKRKKFEAAVMPCSSPDGDSWGGYTYDNNSQAINVCNGEDKTLFILRVLTDLQ